MITLQEISRLCPAKNWARHEFYETVKLPHSEQILMHKFSLPRGQQEIREFLITGDKVALLYGDMLGHSANNQSICDALAYLLNQRMKRTQTDILYHLNMTVRVLSALKSARYVSSYILLRGLSHSLIPYAGQIWLYEWSEWIKSVEGFILDKADKSSLNIIKNLPNIN